MTTPPLPSTSPVVININGQIYMNQNEAKISVFDRGFLFGDSVYEVTRTYRGIPFLLQDHLDRLWHSASRLEMPLSFDQNYIVGEVNKALAELGLENAYIRIVITRGEGEIALDPGKSQKNNLVIITKEQKENPAWWYEKGVHAVITNVVRTSRESVDPNIKSGNYLNNVMAYMKAKKEQAFDSIMLNSKGHVTQGTTSNIWIVKNDEIWTPTLDAGILEGITRKTLLQLAKKNGLSVQQKNFTSEDLANADECFLTGTVKEVVPVTQVENSPIGVGVPGPITQKLMAIYHEFIQNCVGGPI